MVLLLLLNLFNMCKCLFHHFAVAFVPLVIELQLFLGEAGNLLGPECFAEVHVPIELHLVLFLFADLRL
jgi:hypothetical protein